MTEEIIIDCAFYKDGVCASPINKTCEYCKNIDVSKCYHKQLIRLEQERDELKKTVENQKLEYEELQCDLSEVENACGCYQSENAELKQENKELSFAVEKCLENAGIECDDEEQALRSLPMLGNAHYKVLVEKDELEQENKELKADILKWQKAFSRQYQINENKGYSKTEENYRSALEKIKDLCTHYENTNDKCVINCYAHFIVTDLIQNKINEVLNEKEL